MRRRDRPLDILKKMKVVRSPKDLIVDDEVLPKSSSSVGSPGLDAVMPVKGIYLGLSMSINVVSFSRTFQKKRNSTSLLEMYLWILNTTLWYLRLTSSHQATLDTPKR